MESRSVTFTTREQRVYGTTIVKQWSYSRPKDTGLSSGGDFDGFYTTQDENEKAFIKQDATIENNIAEFLAGKVYQKIIPHASAKIHLARVDEAERISANGKNVYIVSEFVPGWQHDLYADIQLALGNNPQRSSCGALEALQLFYRLMICNSEFSQVFMKAMRAGDYLNFGEISGVSLLINNIDTHLGNIGIVQDNKSAPKILVVIDYGFAWRNMTNKINPHSFTKYLFSHARRGQGWNNFMFYPEAAKINAAFVSGIDKATNTDLTETINQALLELIQFYGRQPLIAFANRFGLPDPSNHPEDQFIKILSEQINQNIKIRQHDLARFSAQIKIDLCLRYDPIKNNYLLEGYTDHNYRKVAFTDVVLQHNEYFIEIQQGIEQFKFRQTIHKHRDDLIALVTSEAARVLRAERVSSPALPGLETDLLPAHCGL